MILFYSNYCQHCNILLETIQKHDKNKIVKTVSIDTLRSMQKPIDPKIHSVPALLLLNTKEYIFGKAVFDYLLLPNRGILFASNSTRNEKRITRESDASSIPEVATENVSDEPMAFTLGSISAEHFSNIDDTDTAINDKNYNWDMINNENNSKVLMTSHSMASSSSVTDDPHEKKKLPSMEEIMKQRSLDIQ
jgi:hypothetical protein